MSTVTYTRTGPLARIELDRPPLNVLDIAMLEELDGVLELLAGDRAIKVVALAGSGKAFCAGADVADHAADRVERMLAAFHAAIRRLVALEVPTVALVHGAALGGGAELALACDIVLARSDLRLGQPEIRLGVFPPVAAALLPRLVGRQRALDLVLSGRELGAEESHAMGLVSHVYSLESFREETAAYLNRLTQLSGSSLRLAKRAVTVGIDECFDTALGRAESLYLDDLVKTPDANEGIAAFLGKRRPVWVEA
ncbi:MAG: enoyl-CoA hydratase/isomerase family protein [Gemmatimonadales bacterium]